MPDQFEHPLSRLRHLTLLAGGALAVMLTVSGCSDLVVDDEKAQDAIEADIVDKSRIPVSSVECPRDVAVTPGDSFSCVVEAADGRRYRAKVLILDDKANLRFESLEPQP